MPENSADDPSPARTVETEPHREHPSNTRMHPTAFGARDRRFFEVVLCRVPRRRVMRNPLGGAPYPLKLI
jgi:hypothetical protein